MNKNIQKIVGLLIVLTLMSSCEEKPLSKINFSEGNYKLYFYSYPEQDTNTFFSRHKNFYIDKNSILNKIKNNIILEKSSKIPSSHFLYIFRLVNNNEMIDGGVLDVVNEEILYNNVKYGVDLKQLEDYKTYFKNLNSYEINCVTISNTKHFIKFIESTDGFIFNSSKNRENPILKFNGTVELITDTVNVDFKGGWEKFPSRFISDFKNIGEISIINSNYDGGNKIHLTMLWKNDYTSKLPERYKIIKQYTDTLSIPLRVYDISEKEILSFFNHNKVEGYSIKNLNE